MHIEVVKRHLSVSSFCYFSFSFVSIFRLILVFSLIFMKNRQHHRRRRHREKPFSAVY